MSQRDLPSLLAQLDTNTPLVFADVLALIDQLYQFTPQAFQNGDQHNAANQNNGSCKCLAFAQLQQLSQAQTLQLFGEHYRDVLANPQGDNHQNIRQFMLQGWEGVLFAGEVLAPIKK